MSRRNSLFEQLERNRTSSHMIIKRDGRKVEWDQSRVIRAICLSYFDVLHPGEENQYKEDGSHFFGIDPSTFTKAVRIADHAATYIENKYFRAGQYPTIEQIQDAVEIQIMSHGEYEVARNYIQYRARQAELRMTRYPSNGLSDYVIQAKYMRYRPDLKRREIFTEAVDRVRDMHLAKYIPPLQEKDGNYNTLEKYILDAFEGVRQKKVWPSSRSLQFGGVAISHHEARMFNCTYSPINRLEFFREYIYLLLCGCGCGFSVQWHHVEQMPEFPYRAADIDLPVKHFEIPDSIEGWADAVHELLMSYLRGYYVEFNFSKIRPKGAPLKKSGGKAPGHLPLKKALGLVKKIMDKVSGRKLRPIEAYDICMHLAKAVLAGGVRRSATICLFSSDDGEMMTAKTGDWWSKTPWRSASNNSAVLLRDSASYESFRKLFDSTIEFGEPGFFFSDNEDYGTNPCCEIGLNSRVDIDVASVEKLQKMIEEWEDKIGRQYTVNGEPVGQLEVGDVLHGWQYCNLSTINGSRCETAEEFYESCRRASIIGTLQAGYVNTPYVGPLTKFINEREALLGVSITGVMDSPHICLSPEILRRGAEIVKSTNRQIAEMIGINPAARTTCVKPEGTASLALGTASGIHPHHAHRYFRRVQANRHEAVYQHFKAMNASMTEPGVQNPDTDDVITFPVEAPPHAIVKGELNATQFLESVRIVQENWVMQGQASEDYSPGLHHNVSNTVTFKKEEVEDVARWIWDHRDAITGISLLIDAGDKIYPQAPQEAVHSDQDIHKWNSLKYVPVDYSTMVEYSDETKLKDNWACTGNQCELR